MKWLVFLLAAPLWAQHPMASMWAAQIGNCFHIYSLERSAYVTWSTPSTFRFRRHFGPEFHGCGEKSDEVKVALRELHEEYVLKSTLLSVSVRKDDLRVKVTKLDGTPLMVDATAVERREGVLSWERTAEPGVRFYGLGAQTGASLNLRGMLVRDATPFFFSTAGYGEMHVAAGKYDFDMERLRRGRYRIDIRNSDTIDYYFYFGPTPKEIFEERHKTIGAGFASHQDVAAFDRMIEQSLSAVVLPVATVASIAPAALRSRLDAYLGAYVQEVQDRGYPILHPLPFQFAGDPEGDLHRDESMLGDELLIATGPSVYLPRGIWTNLKSNEITAGRKTIPVADPPGVFARNGSIVPLAGDGTLELHYFPKLGAEFFLYDEDAGDYTQVHAAPAADIVRLEIESKVARDYTWVVHRLEGVISAAAAGEVEFERMKRASDLRPRSWYYDAESRNVYVRARVAAGEDLIVNLSFGTERGLNE